MFSGIIHSLGTVTDILILPSGGKFSLASDLLLDTKTGDSVAVSGVCLTIVSRTGEVARFDVSSETLRRSTLGTIKVGDQLNLEQPLKLSDLLHGHLVQGHVDCQGGVLSIREEGDTTRIEIEIPQDQLRYIAEKGSITVDGVSLTAADVTDRSFAVYVIPKTRELTTLRLLTEGARVNIELDILAKYVERLCQPKL